MNIERRLKPRINDPVSVVVRGLDTNGKTYCFYTVAKDVGSEGLCAPAPRIMKEGERISLRIRLARAGSNPVQAPAVAACAVVLRVNELTDKSSLFAVSFLSRSVL